MISGHPSNQVSQDSLVIALARNQLFQGLPEADLRTIAGWLRPVDVVAGTVVCRQGDPAAEMYLIESGQVQIAPDHGRYIYDYLGPGAFFGEIALLGDGRRTATVTVTMPGRFWVIPKEAFDYLLKERPQLRTMLVRVAADRMQMQHAHATPAQAAAPIQAAPPAPPRPAVGSTNERQAVSFPLGKTTLLLGRHQTCDVVIADPQVSRFHARIDQASPNQATITDLESSNGVYVNQVRIPPNTPYPLRNGDEFWVGRNPYRFEDMDVVQFARPAGVKLDAYHLTRIVGKKKQITILNDISLSIQPGEFVAVVGGSGAGKSTLLSALTGFTPATEGRVFYNGIDYYQHFDLFRTSLGYVPQDDIIHKQLTVQQVLHYAARLRLPPDTTEQERSQLVEAAMQQLQLTERRDTQVSELSGGQRKRVSIGVELLNQPGLFFLDEPTSGLDPGLEETMMYLFRDLSRQGRTVIVITHATKNINTCDKVIFLARGGYLAFYGTPKEALEYFGVDDFTGIYRRLETEGSPAEWAQHFVQTTLYQRNIVEQLNQNLAVQGANQGPVTQTVKKPTPSALRQYFVLVGRYLAILRRDRALLAIFFLQPPVIAFALTGMFKRDLFDSDPQKAVFLMFITTVASIFLGAMNSAREITKENAIYIRERLVNLKILPYVASKVSVLGLLSFFQAAIFLLVIAGRVAMPSDQGAWMVPKLYLTLSLANLGGMAMGLMISALVNNEDKATGLVPMVILPQMSLAGAMIPVSAMPKAGGLISNLAISRWAFENMAITTGLSARLDTLVEQHKMPENVYKEVFTSSQPLHWIVLISYVVILLILATLLVKRKDVR